MKSDVKLLAAFHTHLLTEKRVSENTFLAYQRDIDQLAQFLRSKKQLLSTAKADHLKKFLRELKNEGLKARTLSRKISSIKLLYAFLEERYEIENIASVLLFPKLEKTLPLYLTPKEIERLFAAANKDESAKGFRNKVMLSLLYASGMRISELLSLKTHQVNFNTGFIQLSGKGNKERSIPLPQNILKLMRYYIDTVYNELLPKDAQNPEKFVFISVRAGKVNALTRQAFWGLLKKLLIKAKITKNISPHSLRHSLATHLLKMALICVCFSYCWVMKTFQPCKCIRT